MLIAALAVAAWHLAALYFGAHGQGERSVSQLVTEILAIVLPPVGAAATGLQSAPRAFEPVLQGSRKETDHT